MTITDLKRVRMNYRTMGVDRHAHDHRYRIRKQRS